MNGEGKYVNLCIKVYKKLEKRAKKRNSTVDIEVNNILNKVLDEE